MLSSPFLVRSDATGFAISPPEKNNNTELAVSPVATVLWTKHPTYVRIKNFHPPQVWKFVRNSAPFYDKSYYIIPSIIFIYESFAFAFLATPASVPFLFAFFVLTLVSFRFVSTTGVARWGGGRRRGGFRDVRVGQGSHGHPFAQGLPGLAVCHFIWLFIMLLSCCCFWRGDGGAHRLRFLFSLRERSLRGLVRNDFVLCSLPSLWGRAVEGSGVLRIWSRSTQVY